MSGILHIGLCAVLEEISKRSKASWAYSVNRARAEHCGKLFTGRTWHPDKRLLEQSLTVNSLILITRVTFINIGLINFSKYYCRHALKPFAVVNTDAIHFL